MSSDADVEPQGERRYVLKLIDFLSEYDAQRNQPVRNIADYRMFRLPQQSLPDHEAVTLHPSDSEWLAVDFIDLPKAPSVPEQLWPHIENGTKLSASSRPKVTVPKPDFEALDTELRRFLDTAVEGEEPPSRLITSDADRRRQQAAYEQQVRLAEQWIDSEWLPWSERYKSDSAVKTLHRSIFEQRESLLLEREAVELVWGFGRARWSVDGYIVDHPLLTIPVEIALDQNSQRISVLPAGPVEVEIRYLAGISLHDRQSLSSARQSVDESELDPWNPEEVVDLFRRVARSIDDNAVVENAAGLPTSNLVVDHSWTLYARRRVPDSQGFLDQMRAIYLANGVISDPLRDVVARTSDKPVTDAENADRSSPDRSEPLLLPLATNEEQKRILELAQRHPGVTVQGPPGTGKSHTIANLISHYVAYGQRVLVVAEKEQALKVLSDKIPEGIRDLTVSVLGADEQSRKSLEKAVTTIQSKVGTMDPRAADDVINRLRMDLDAANRGIALTTTQMLRARQAEVDRAPGSWIPGDNPTPQVAAEWVRSNADALGYIPDAIDLSAKPPLSDTEYAEYIALLEEVGLEQARDALSHLPSLESVPSSASLREILDTIASGDRRAAAVRTSFFDWDRFVLASASAVRKVQTSLSEYAERLSSLELSAYSNLLTRLSDNLLREELTEYYEAISRLRQEAIQHRRALMASVVKLGTPATQELLSQIVEAQKHLAVTGKLGLFDRQHKRALSAFRVDGRIPQSAEAASLCIAATLLHLTRQHIARLFSNQSPLAGQIQLGERPEDDVATEVNRLKELLDIPSQRRDLEHQLEVLGIRSADLAKAESSSRLAKDIDEAAYHFRSVDALEQIKTLIEVLRKGQNQADASPLWAALLEVLHERNLERWDVLRKEASKLLSLVQPARRLVELDSRLLEVAPEWRQTLVSDPAQAPWRQSVAAAWQWRQLDCWVSGVTTQASPAELQHELDNLGQQRRRTVSRLVEALAWRRLSDNLGPSQRQALQAYLKAVTRYGKTGGKYAQRWIREMREALNDSKDAVPVWIMTTSRAVTSFRPSEQPPFDVLIVDEASQIGFEALPLLSLAKKAIVVGDDKQTSPEHVGMDRQKVFDIMDDHLADVPKYRTLFDPDNSLYDLAIQKFATPVMLSEHFRCLPEIIEFSNVQAYNRRIVPLRDQPPHPGWVPLGVLRVTDGYRVGDINEPEALQVASLVMDMCSDERYDGMSFGVVTLLGTSQAKLIWEKLYELLGPEQMEERQVRCGEAANFQGDERDIVIISTVVAPDPNLPSTRFGAMTSVKDLRKINVAASRARNQMWVVTSVDPDMLPNGDLRAALIRHCSSFVSSAPEQQKVLEACESEFERSVVNDLLARGYGGVEVQKTVGRYRLDIVVSGPERRLAIECDGDRWHGPDVWHQDRARQEVLERAGWTFERVRGSA